jgi:hypothetical protein
MPLRKSGVAVLFVATGAAMTIAAAPVALADSCDPAVVVCDTPGNVQINDAPPPVATTDVNQQYPFDDEWYFNPAGGGTALQPNHVGGGHH